ncbi:DUF445 domain-containing protein [Paenibacillus thermoaerophilus]|uniref:DUF445 domain-containing protein n=1 Tax=Paenibacillus thermoaerophilus TaxID=1215385 RepID=A0ABW2V6A3_9BACL|nr:DUF445 domain-containing protein [Paenibacillus thermoaerophilus]TMV13897.1 DUF445 domain-containing protein [Paenibacillus thermoaerophilus]
MKSRYLAGLSLAVMATGFVVTLFLPQTFIVRLLQAGFEAGLVGGIADWFAVTALFRHPLGIPIPHTSLLLKNKERIVRSLVSALENELLNKRSIGEKLSRLNLLGLGAAAIARRMASKTFRRGVAEALIPVVRELPLERAVPTLQAGLAGYIARADWKPTAERALTRLMEERYDERAFDYVLREVSRWVVRAETKAMLGKIASSRLAEVRMGGFMGFAVQAFAGFMDEEQLGGILQNMLVAGLRDLQNRDNPYRNEIVRELRVRLFQLADEEERLASLKDWLRDTVQGDGATDFLRSRLEELRALALDKLERERDNGGRGLFAAYRGLIRWLSGRPDWIGGLEKRLRDGVVRLVEENHYRIGELVKENLNRMDDEALVRMLEEKVGKDLQWIRVNGAICGFVIGLALFFVQSI